MPRMLTVVANELQRELTTKINIVSRDPVQSGVKKEEKIIKYINEALKKIKALLKSEGFTDEAEEIMFYKEINPLFYALLIYHGTIFNIHTRTTPGSTKHRVKYLENELRKIDDFFYHNQDFYLYYRTGRTNMDNEYFVRKNNISDSSSDLYSAIMDNEYCTLYSLKISNILANEWIREYLNAAIAAEFQPTRPADPLEIESMQWTESKTGLYEFIYALYASKVFNNGKATLESITRYFEKVFFIELKTPTITFQEILRRKKGLTFFIDWVRNKYLLYVESIEERNRQRRSRK
jgi:hypothetical protein